MDEFISQHAEEALHYLKGQIPSDLERPTIAIICGSGLGGLADIVLSQSHQEVQYKDIPHFPTSQGIIPWAKPCFSSPTLIGRSARSCWKTPLWVTQIISESRCSHDGKSSVSLSAMFLLFGLERAYTSKFKLLRRPFNPGYYIPCATTAPFGRGNYHRC